MRCKSRENPDTCEDFYKQSYENYCDLLIANNQFWQPYYNTIEPKLKCPLKKVVIHACCFCRQCVVLGRLQRYEQYYWGHRLLDEIGHQLLLESERASIPRQRKEIDIVHEGWGAAWFHKKIKCFPLAAYEQKKIVFVCAQRRSMSTPPPIYIFTRNFALAKRVTRLFALKTPWKSE